MLHIPVMVEEVMKYLNVKEGGTYVDATAGGGGHLKRIIEAVGERGKVIAVDQNRSAVEYLQKFKVQSSKFKVEVVRGNYRFIEKIAEKCLGGVGGRGGVGQVDGVLFDLGFSSDEIAETGRGFSFDDAESLDMRYSQGEHGEFLCECHTEEVKSQKSKVESQGNVPISNFQFPISAEDVVNTFSEKELADIFWKYGDEKRSRFFAKKIVEYRERWRIESAAELAYVIGTARPTFEGFQTLVRHAHARPASFHNFQTTQLGSSCLQEVRVGKLRGESNPAPSGADSKNSSVVVLDQHFQNGQKVRGRAFAGRLNPATKAFMALRIFVNREFENVEVGLRGAVNVLKPGGRCVVISFHSGEDRIVKEFIKEQASAGKIENLTKHVVKPSREEVLRNRLSRSAVMRAFEKK